MQRVQLEVQAETKRLLAGGDEILRWRGAAAPRDVRGERGLWPGFPIGRGVLPPPSSR